MLNNIAFYCTSKSKGGLELNLVKTAIEFKNQDVEILVLAPKDTYIFEFATQNNLKTYHIRHHNKYFDYIQALSINKILKNNNIKHLVVFDNYDTDICSILKSINNKIKLYYHLNLHVGTNKKDCLHTIRYNKYDNWILPLEILKKDVLRLTNYPSEKIEIINIGVDVGKFEKNYNIKAIKEKYGISNNKFIIGTIGRIDYLKGQLVLLKAFRHIENEDIEVVIVGEPTKNERDDYFLEIKRFISLNNLENRIKFINFTKNVDEIFKIFDIFCLTSLSETYGLVTIEAMISGIPIIATNSGGTPELTEYGKYAKLYDPKNDLELSEKIIEIKKDYEKYKTIANEAQNYAKVKFSKQNEIIKWIELFKSNNE